MSLSSYLARLEDTLASRQDITVDILRVTVTTLGAIFEAELRYYDGSQLSVIEQVERAEHGSVRRIAYKFHYQQADGTLVFRYDTAPHHSHLSTHPHHKHIGDKIIESEAPDLAEVLREIDARIYPQANHDH
jgi:hypothetical protein